MILLMSLGGLTLAQETAPEPEAGSPPPVQTPAPEPANKPEPAAAPPPASTAAAKSPDSFTPSEEISEDLSVSFPVDI